MNEVRKALMDVSQGRWVDVQTFFDRGFTSTQLTKETEVMKLIESVFIQTIAEDNRIVKFRCYVMDRTKTPIEMAKWRIKHLGKPYAMESFPLLQGAA